MRNVSVPSPVAVYVRSVSWPDDVKGHLNAEPGFSSLGLILRSSFSSLVIYVFCCIVTWLQLVSFIENLCRNELSTSIEVIKCRRLGQPQPGRLQPVHATLRSSGDAEAAIRSAKNLRQSKDTIVRNSIYINADMTKAESLAAYQRRCRRRELAARRATNTTRSVGVSVTTEPGTSFAASQPSTDRHFSTTSVNVAQHSIPVVLYSTHGLYHLSVPHLKGAELMLFHSFQTPYLDWPQKQLDHSQMLMYLWMLQYRPVTDQSMCSTLRLIDYTIQFPVTVSPLFLLQRQPTLVLVHTLITQAVPNGFCQPFCLLTCKA